MARGGVERGRPPLRFLHDPPPAAHHLDGAAEVARVAVLAAPARVLDLAGRTSLADVLGVVAEAELFVGNDSGLAHLSNAAGTPTTVVFGPTDPDATRPWDGPRPDGAPVRLQIARERVPCAPCRFKRCPLDHACMTGLTLDLPG